MIRRQVCRRIKNIWNEGCRPNMKKSWELEDSGQTDYHWDIYWCDLNADINSAEVD